MNETLFEAGATMKFGTISAVDEKSGMVRVRLPDFDNMRTAWLHVLQARTQDDKEYDLFDIGEQVVVLLDARGEDGVVLGSIYSSADRPPVTDVNKYHRRFKDGSWFEYDRATHAMRCHSVGTMTSVAAGTMTLQASEIILDTPLVTCTGSVTTQGDVTVSGKLQANGGVACSGALHASGNISSDGAILDSAGNSNHHSH